MSGHLSPSRVAHLLRAYDLNGPRANDRAERTETMAAETTRAADMAEAAGVIDGRKLAHLLREQKRDLKLWLVAELATHRRRLDELEAVHEMRTLPDDYLDHHAEHMAAALDDEAD
jgi:cytidylate kinase